MKTPLIIVNFKAYRETTGRKGIRLAKICDVVAKEENASIVITVQNTDIFEIAKEVNIPILSEHVDPIEFGAHTGKVLPEAVKEDGAVGTIINHSEDKQTLEDTEKTIKRAKEAGLVTVVCASTPEEAEKIAMFDPDFIAIEPPELIGGNISVSTAQPDIIVKTVERIKKIKDIPVLCGAGVKTKEDVAKAIELGSKGILVASGVDLSKDPEKELKNLIAGLNG